MPALPPAANARYTALLIDLDGVIRHWPGSDAAIETGHGLPVSAIRKAAFAPDLLLAAITGRITDQAWRQHTVERLAREFDSTSAAQAVAQWSANPGAVDQRTLAVLGACVAGLRVVLLTNATSRLGEDLRSLGLHRHFAAVVNSSDVGVAKPAAEIFRIALERAGATADRALFIDDVPANVEAAWALGIRSHQFTAHAAMSAFLQQAGVLRRQPHAIAGPPQAADSP